MAYLHQQAAWRPYVATDLSALSGASAANGLASIVVRLSGTVAFRTTQSTIEVVQVGWAPGHPVPSMTSTPGSVTVRRRGAADDDDHEAGDDNHEAGDDDHEARDDDDEAGDHDDEARSPRPRSPSRRRPSR